MRKPLIGITVNYDPLDTVGMESLMGITGQDWDFVAGDYVYGLEKAGATPVLIPRTADNETLKPLIDALDGVLVSGGHDVDPASYQERILGHCGRIVPERDAMDIFITRYAYEQGKAILGICRGCQIMNVAFGGNMYQDLEKESDGKFLHHFMGNSPRNRVVHKDTLAPGSIVAQIFGKETLSVNSYHHQAVKEPGENVTFTAWSEDGVPEALEISGKHPFVVGVQWHPEMMFDSEEQLKIFQAFTEACR